MVELRLFFRLIVPHGKSFRCHILRWFDLPHSDRDQSRVPRSHSRVYLSLMQILQYFS